MNHERIFKKLIKEVKRLILSDVELLPHLIGISHDGRVLEVIYIGEDICEFHDYLESFFQACEIQKFYLFDQFVIDDEVSQQKGVLVSYTTLSSNQTWICEIFRDHNGKCRLVDPQLIKKGQDSDFTKLLTEPSDILSADSKKKVLEFLFACRLPNGIVLWPPHHDGTLSPHPKQTLLSKILRLHNIDTNIPSVNDIVRSTKDPKPNNRLEDTILLAKSLLLSTGELVATVIGFRSDGSAIQLHLPMVSVGSKNWFDYFAANDITEIHFIQRFIATSGVAVANIDRGIPDLRCAKGPECIAVNAVTPDYRWTWCCQIMRDKNGAVECLTNFYREGFTDISCSKRLFPEERNHLLEERKKFVEESISKALTNTYKDELNAMKDFANDRLSNMQLLAAKAEHAVRMMYGFEKKNLEQMTDADMGRIIFPDGRIAYLGMVEKGNYYRFFPNIKKDAFSEENSTDVFAILLGLKGARVTRMGSASCSTIHDHAEYRDFGLGPQLSIDCSDQGIIVDNSNEYISTEHTS